MDATQVDGDPFIINGGVVEKIVTGGGVIVVVDDDIEQHEILRMCYEESDRKNELIFFSAGSELLDYMDKLKEPDDASPELVLLDINMPGVSGYQTLEAIRSHPRYQTIPVVVMFTSSTADTDIQKSKELGATKFWEKPMVVDDYLTFFHSI